MTTRPGQLQRRRILPLLAALVVCLLTLASTRRPHASAAQDDPRTQSAPSGAPETPSDVGPQQNPSTETPPPHATPGERAANEYGDFGALASPQPQSSKAPTTNAAGPSAAGPNTSGPNTSVPSAAAPYTSGPSAPAPSTITDLIIIADVTASMRNRCRAGGEQRMAIAQWAMYDLLDAVPDDLPTSLVALHGAASEVQPLEPLTPDHKIALRRVIVRMRPEGAAQLKSGFDETRALLASRPQATPLVVLLTDGEDCHPGDAAGAAAELKQQFGDRWHFIVVAINSQSQIQEQLSSLARAAGGEFTWVTSAAELPPALAGARSLANAVRQQRAESLARTQRELTTSQRHLAACADHARTLGNRLDASFQLEGELRTLLKGRQAECDAARKEIDSFKQSLAAAEKGIQRFQAELTKARHELQLTENNVKSLTSDLEYERDIYAYAQHYWFWIACALIGILLLASLFFAQRQVWMRREVRRFHDETAGLRTRLQISDDQSRGYSERVNQLNGQLSTANSQLDDARRQHTADDHSADEQQRKIEQQMGDLRQVSAEYAAERSRADGLQKQVDQLWQESVRLKSDLSASQSARTAAEAQALGATREMAANKKDCCPPGPVIAPTVVPSTPSLSGAPSAPSAPSSSAAGSPSAPSAPGSSSAAGSPSAPSSAAASASAPSAPSSASSAAAAPGQSSSGGGGSPLSTMTGGAGGLGSLAGTAIGTAIGGPTGAVAGQAIGGLVDSIFNRIHF